ncbi:glycosyltransferase family 1 protein [Pseudomonas sp. A-1]|uniref:glycosyltransferase n=1 Tax=unclassified Pseudomonas TaxID=196821 RepID=UPI0010A66780|nr:MULTISPECIES: glycosyltransferase family 1 protein [unclassified Pseudomonas]THG77813.1 glycosyltransferase family 1 protein [Pseudomonas sp. A-1]
MNYADVLRVSGFADVRDVAARLNAWQGLFSLVRPDVLVADHAPTALLAAQLAEIPRLSIGNGFVIPPAVHPWPSIRSWEPVSDQALATAETSLDCVLDAAQKSLGHTRAVRVRNLFGEYDILDTFAELDHYGARPNGRYVGPIVSVPHALRVSWQSREGPKVLAYLRPAVPGFAAILQALVRLDAEVLCVAPGMSPEAAKRCATRRLRIALAPVDLPPLLEHADLALGYGNGGFSTQALLAGVPLAMRPRHVEQALFAHRVEALGAGKLLVGRIDADSVTASLQELLDKRQYRQAAQTFQSTHRYFSPEQAVEQSLSLIERAFLDSWKADPTQHAQCP